MTYSAGGVQGCLESIISLFNAFLATPLCQRLVLSFNHGVGYNKRDKLRYFQQQFPKITRSTLKFIDNATTKKCKEVFVTDDKERIENAKWLLERTLGWIATADIKGGFAIALNTGMIGGLAAAFAGSDYHLRTAWCYFFVFVSVSGMAAAMFCAGMAALPRMRGPINSMIFFGRIAAMEVSTYIDKFSRMTEKELLADLTTQIHRNSEISHEKHQWVRKSLFFSFISANVWIVAIAMLVKI